MRVSTRIWDLVVFGAQQTPKHLYSVWFPCARLQDHENVDENTRDVFTRLIGSGKLGLQARLLLPQWRPR